MNSRPISGVALLSAAFAVALAMLGPAPASAQVFVDWTQFTRGVSVALDAADNVFTVDYEQAPGAEMVLTKRDARGSLLWTAMVDQPSSTLWERASWVATDSTGSAIVCGTLMSGFSNPVEAASIVMKVAPSGQVVWRQVYETSFDGSAVKKCLVDGADNVYVLGLGNGPAGRVTKVKKFAPDGTAVWSFFDAAGIGAPLNFKLTPDRNILMTGQSITGSRAGYAKIDLDGRLLWAYAGVPSLTTGDSAGDAFGNSYLVHGEFAAAGGTVIEKLDAQGALVWRRVHALAGFRIEVGPDGAPIVSGFPNGGSPGAAFIKVDPNGVLVWSNLNADGPLALLAHAHMRLDVDGNAYLAAGTMSEMAVCKVNSDGGSAWTQTVAFGYAQALALSNLDQSVYVVGGTTARLGQGTPPVPTIPAPPTALTSLALTPTSATLSWSDNSSNETGFTVERCTGTPLFCAGNPGGWAVRAVTASGVATFNDAGLVAATAYNWRVNAFNAVGASSYSNTLARTTPADPAVPAAPTGLTAQARRVRDRAEVRLAWVDNATTETGYILERCSGNACVNFVTIATLPANAVARTDAAVSRNTTYRYRVAATGSGVTSGYSAIVAVRTP